MRTYLLILVGLLCQSVAAQISDTLTLVEYIEAVRTGHPMMQVIDLQSDVADQTVRMARGGFDPKVEADWQQKDYDDKNYYALGSAAVKLPTWYGIDLKATYDRSAGDFLDDSDFLPARGLFSAGISVGLGRGLILDSRRAELEKAKLFSQSTKEMQILMENDLLYEAGIAYLEWQIAEANLAIAREGLSLADTRLTGVVSSFVNGDKPAIDTLETFISLQNRQIDYDKALQTSIQSRILVDNYLWIDGNVPVELTPGTVPEPLEVDLAIDLVDSLTVSQREWLDSHPELRLYDFKLSELDVDVRLSKEDLKPDIRLDYNPLVGVGDDQLFNGFNPSDFKFGAKISYPLMQRKQRGKLQLNKLKVETTTYDQSIKRQSLDTKLDQYLNDIARTSAQYDVLTSTAANYLKMLQAENRKLQVGESSIFLVNSRESKYLDSRYKVIQAGGKVVKNRLTYLYLAAWLGSLWRS